MKRGKLYKHVRIAYHATTSLAFRISHICFARPPFKFSRDTPGQGRGLSGCFRAEVRMQENLGPVDTSARLIDWRFYPKHSDTHPNDEPWCWLKRMNLPSTDFLYRLCTSFSKNPGAIIQEENVMNANHRCQDQGDFLVHPSAMKRMGSSSQQDGNVTGQARSTSHDNHANSPC